jgi:hypothetical protein
MLPTTTTAQTAPFDIEINNGSGAVHGIQASSGSALSLTEIQPGQTASLSFAPTIGPSGTWIAH